MKKLLSLVMTFLIVLSMSWIFASQVEATTTTIKVLHVSVLEQNEVQRIIDNSSATSLFNVTQVGIAEFNSSIPSDLSVYDVIVFGINDWGEQFNNRNRTYGRLVELEAYVNEGGGIVWTHDTLLMGHDYGALIEEPAGVDLATGLNIGYTYYSVQIVTAHPILFYPFYIGGVNDTIDIQQGPTPPHTSGGRIVNATRVIRGHDITEIAPDSVEETDNFYLTTHEYGNGRVIVIGALGHNTIREGSSTFEMPPLQECQLFVNALVWASQVSPQVGGIYIPVNKLELLAPYIGLTILLAVVVITVGYVKKRKRNTEINS